MILRAAEGVLMRAYQLFRRKNAYGLFCAVPEGGVMPSFVGSPAWDFDGRYEDDRGDLLGFDARAAATGVHFNGFYLFQAFGPHAERPSLGL